jgi:hypothetical protein
MKKAVALLALCAVMANALAVTWSTPCENLCLFTFCPNTSVLALGTPDKALSPRICHKNASINVGVVGSTGQAFVTVNGSYKLISQYKPIGLRQNFSPSVWKSYALKVIYKGKTYSFSGAGHEMPQQNQANYLHSMCITLPLTSYQVLDAPYGKVIANEHPTNPYQSCVGFTVI